MADSFYNFLHQEKSKKSVTCLISSVYPLLFMAQLRMIVQHGVSAPVEIVAVKEVGVQTVKRFLQTSFLGMHKIYFLHEADDLGTNEKKELLAYLAQYSGPNYVYIVMEAAEGAFMQSWQVVELPAKVDRALWDELTRWYGVATTERTKNFSVQLFKKSTTFSLETACIFIRYMQLLGGNSDEFFDQWFDTLVPPEQSLFLLSQYFFKKDAHNFFTQWYAVKDAYAAQFWISFWSEQLWRATMFIMLNEKQQRAQARAIAFRLPFSFINHDWKNYSADTLVKAHNSIYLIDHNLKNGGSDYAFDFLFSQFFTDTVGEKR